MRILPIIGLTVLGFSFSASADDAATRQLIECAPGKNFAKMADALGSLKADKIDTINTNPSFTLSPRDGGELPSRVFVRARNGQETNLSFSSEGEVSNFISEFENAASSEFCVEDPSRVGMPRTEDAYALDMRFNMNYLNRSGLYEMDELKDGLKDGKSALKKIVGGPGSLFVPSLTHIYVKFEDDEAKPVFSALKGSEVLGDVAFEEFDSAFLIAFDDLKTLGADRFSVSGGAHKLSPSMSREKMEKIMKPKGKADAE